MHMRLVSHFTHIYIITLYIILHIIIIYIRIEFPFRALNTVAVSSIFMQTFTSCRYRYRFLVSVISGFLDRTSLVLKKKLNSMV
jgi:hypothetical protein